MRLWTPPEIGVPPARALVRMELEDSAMARRTTEEALDGENPPSAVFTARNLITVGAVEALRARALQHAVALVGFDDLPLPMRSTRDSR
jgi:LacI family transcriptional regulator